jgi:hypothetical protein
LATRVPGGGVTKNPFGPTWVGGKEAADNLGDQVQDSLFGRKKPEILDDDDPDIDRLMSRLHVYRKKLARMAGDGDDDYDLVLAAGTIASVDSTGLIYVGREFLLRFAESLETHVGVIAHEIGHRPKRWEEYREARPTTVEELADLCRLEETRADYFSGYALGQLGFDCEPLCAFLVQIQVHPHPEYFSADLRAKTIREAHGAGSRRKTNLRKFFPELARMTSASGDLGGG